MYLCYIELFEMELFLTLKLIICIKIDLTLINLQRLICHKTPTTSQLTSCFHCFLSFRLSLPLFSLFLLSFFPSMLYFFSFIHSFSLFSLSFFFHHFFISLYLFSYFCFLLSSLLLVCVSFLFLVRYFLLFLSISPFTLPIVILSLFTSFFFSFAFSPLFLFFDFSIFFFHIDLSSNLHRFLS